MKKFVTVMAVALVAIMSLALFAACGYPQDPQKAANQLEGDGYTVETVTNDNVAGKAALALASTGLDLNDGEELVAMVRGDQVKDSKHLSVTIYYFNSNGAANTAWNSDLIEELKDSTKEGNVNVKKSGKMIWVETM